jgi:hypothetical protein
MPEGYKEGNGFSMVDYPANGEASDWMLAVHGIFAMSPELGTSDKASEAFFIESPQVLKDVLYQNYVWIKQTSLMLLKFVSLDVKNVLEQKRKLFESTKIIVDLDINSDKDLTESHREGQNVRCTRITAIPLYKGLVVGDVEFYNYRKHWDYSKSTT